ncbi:MAG: DegT/DnrJ/EryC1/StrS family aminotransferase [Nitrospirales bacterium]
MNDEVKSTIDTLAICGGKPAFHNQLHVGSPNVGKREEFLKRVNQIFDNRWLTNNGSYVQEFERKISAMTGNEHCIATCNGTVALELAIRALGFSGQVIVPSMTFIATAHALWWQGITPIFCDIETDSFCLDPKRVEGLITPTTTGIIGVHLFGHPCDVNGLAAVAARHNLRLLYDASHAFGCSKGCKMIGGFGNAEVFSFHATKFLNTFEGGAIVTNDDALAQKIRLMKNFGFSGYDKVIYIGTNGKMSEVSAAMGLTNLESIDEFIEHNYRNYKDYERELQDIPGITLTPYDESEKCNYQYIVIEVDGEDSQLKRDDLMQILWAENVMARRYFYPGCHRMEPYKAQFPNAGLLLPRTEEICNRVLSLPTGTAISRDHISGISGIIRTAMSHNESLSRHLVQK